MLNLELPGVSLLLAVSLIGAFFSASPVATRYVSPFYAASKGVVRNRSKFFRKPERLEYYLKGGDFF